VTIRGRHPRYGDDEVRAKLTRDLQPGDAGSALPSIGGLLRSMDTSHLRPNFEGIGMDEDPDAYDRMKDRRLGG
jgi:hypothetical protein